MAYKNIDSVSKKIRQEKKTVSNASNVNPQGSIKSKALKFRVKKSHLQKLASAYLMLLMVLQSMAGVLMYVPEGNEAKAAGNTYYVSTTGSDTNNGTSPSTPWAHHPWDMNATNVAASTVLQPGDSVYYKKGEIFYGTYLNVHDSGSIGNNIITSSTDAFGSGADPILSGAWDPSSLAWSLDSGTIYKTLTVNAAPNIVVYNSTILAKGSSKVLNANQWWWGDDGGTNYLFVNVGDNPSNGTLQAGKNNFVVYNDSSDNITVSHIQTQVPNNSFGAIFFYNNRSNFAFDDITVKYVPGLGMYFSDVANLNVSNCSISDAYTANEGVAVGIVKTTGNVNIKDNTIFNFVFGIRISLTDNAIVSGNNLYNLTGSAIKLDRSNHMNLASNVIHDDTNNDSSGDSSCIRLSNSNFNNIYSNTLYNCANGSYYGAGGGSSAMWVSGSSESNNIYKNLLYDNYAGIIYETGSGAGGDKIYDNIFYDETVNDISIFYDPGTNPIEIYNNTVIHNPSSNNVPPYTGHGIAVQSNSKKAKIANNLVVNAAPLGGNNQAMCISNTASNVIMVNYDYNHIYSTSTGSLGKLEGPLGNYQYASLPAWVAAIQADAKVTDLAGAANQAGAHDQTGDPRLTDLAAHNLVPLYTSPAIDSGTPISGITKDYLGNPIYGTPDIGAYEYQPPYSITSDNPNTSSPIRIYADGKYRYTNTVSGSNTAKLKITPQGGFGTGDYSQWMDVDINAWNTSSDYYKKWTEESPNHNLTTLHTIGDLSPRASYILKIDGQETNIYDADSSGQITFTYQGGYSQHTFEVQQKEAVAFIPPVKPSVSNINVTSDSTGSITLNNLPSTITEIAISANKDFTDSSWEDISKKEEMLKQYANEKEVYIKFRTQDGGVSDAIVYNIQTGTQDTSTGDTSSNTDNAASINDGDAVKTPSSPDIYIIKIINNKKYKRLILSPNVFNSYHHLKWESVKTISEEELNQYQTSNLVREALDNVIYAFTPQGDTGQRQPFNATQTYDPDSVYTINKTERDSYEWEE